MKRLIILANAVLLVAVLAAGIALQNHRPAARRPDLAPFNPEAGGSEASATAAQSSVAVRGLALRDSEKDLLWEETLFDPDRREGGEEGENDDAPSPPSQKVGDMELIGIGKIDKRQAAIILVRSRRGGSGKQSATKNIYRVNDEINNTGYTLIRIEKGEVELARNEESRILALDLGDTASQQRASRAAAADQQQRRETQQQESTPETNDAPRKPPPPPPPPPAPGAGSTPSENRSDNSQDDKAQRDRRERIRRALEARRRLLEKRRQERKNNQ